MGLTLMFSRADAARATAGRRPVRGRRSARDLQLSTSPNCTATSPHHRPIRSQPEPSAAASGARRGGSFRRRKLAMIALAFVVLLCAGGDLCAGDRRHQADRLQVQRARSIFPRWATSIARWENPIFRNDRFRDVYPDESRSRRTRRVGPSGRSSIRIRIAACATTSGRASRAIPSGTDGRPSRLQLVRHQSAGRRRLRPNGARHADRAQRRLRLDGHRRRDRHHRRRAGRLLRRLGRHAAQPADRSRDVHSVAGADPGAGGDARQRRRSST